MAVQLKLASRKEQRLTIMKSPSRNADETAKFLSKWPTKCLDHEETISCFCAEHDQLVCNVCILSNHKLCETKLSLLEASKGIRTSRECTLIETGLKKLLDKYEKSFKEQTDILTNLQEQEKEFIKAVKDFRGEINAILDRLENAVMARKDNYATHRKEAVKEHKQSCKTAVTMLDTYCKDIDRTYLGSDEQQLFVCMKKSKLVVGKYEEQYQKISQAPKKVYISFIPNVLIAKFFLTLRDFGDMKADQSIQKLVIVNESKMPLRRLSLGTSDRLSLPSSIGNRSERTKSKLSLPTIDDAFKEIDSGIKRNTRKPVHVGDMSVFLDTDPETPFITGVTFMADDHVVLADDANKNVKLFNNVFQPVSMITLSSPPRDIAPIKLQQVVVTIPTEKSLQFIDLGQTLVLNKKITLDLECSGVACFQNELYVTSGFSNEREVQVISLNGEVRKRFRPGIADLRYPLYIVVEPKFKTIFVSDYNHGVVGLDLNNGDVKFKCKDTDVHGYYKGITLANKGNIYVCTWNLHGVSCVHLDGRGLETIIAMPGKEGRKPYAVAFSKKSERLVVSLCGSKKACLSVFKYQ